MSDWILCNLRDIEAFDSEGLQLSCSSNETARMFDALLRQLVAWSDCSQLGGMDGTLDKMFAADPSALLPRAFKCGLDVMSTGTSFLVNKELEQEMLKLEKDSEKYGTDWEKKHIQAIKNWGYGHFFKARLIWEDILKDHPTDLLAVKMSHDANFFLGDSKEIRDSVGRVLPKWEKHSPGYSYLHGMYAFGLEECGQYREAEKEALTALSLNRCDCWATHAQAHVLEMTGRYGEGIQFMGNTTGDWVGGAYLATHNYWHKALFHVERGEYEAALTVFDREVGPRTTASCAMLDCVDASSLLCRLKMENVPLGDRWKTLPNLSSHCQDHVTAFNDVHFAVLFVGREDYELERKMHDSLVNFTKQENNDNAAINRLVGLQLYEGMVDYMNEKYDQAAEKMLPLREEIVRIGGSNAQRDLFSQALIHSCIESDKPEHWQMTSRLLKERAAIRQGSSPLAERLLLQFQQRHPL